MPVSSKHASATNGKTDFAGFSGIDAEHIAQRLGKAGKSGAGWTALCPAHTDSKPSLSITDADGKILVHCHAGCAQDAVIRALTLRGLWRQSATRNGNRPGTEAVDIDEVRRRLNEKYPGHARKEKPSSNGKTVPRIVATYDYVDEQDELLYQVVRYDPKDFRQRRRDPNGNWVWNMEGTRRVPYRLPKVLDSKFVYVVEGEKDVETLAKLGRTATCNSGGADKWKPEYSAVLKGKGVVVIPDNDDPGRRHAETVAQSVLAAGALWVKVVSLPEAKDITEWVEAGGTKEQLIEAVKRTPWYHPPSGREAQSAASAKVNHNFPFTDLGNAERLVKQYGNDIRWCDPFRCWFVWNKVQWSQDKGQRMVALAKNTVRSTYAQAATIADDEVRKKLMDHSRRTEARSRIDAMIALARPDVAVAPEQFDRDPWLLNVQNGTINLHTGRLQEHDREDLCTKSVNVRYDPEAQCPRWDRFLTEVFGPHPDLISFVQRATGYSLTGDVREECFFLLAGSGRNGKGTLLKTMQALLGDYSGTADFSTFTVGREGGMRDDVANMRGQRFVVAQEAHEGAALAEGVIKWLTGGDRVRARRLYENSSEFDPTFKLWLATNHKPEVRGTDPAIWSRIKLIPFDVSFEGREDKTLKQELLKELPGILAWAVRGCLTWQKRGLQFPQSVVEATRVYRTDSDQVGRFLTERCVKDPDGQTKAARLYEAYKRWCEGNGEKTLTSTVFGSRAPSCPGVSKRTTRTCTVYSGITLRNGD
jgi:putative DNA primase/helicase